MMERIRMTKAVLSEAKYLRPEHLCSKHQSSDDVQIGRFCSKQRELTTEVQVLMIKYP
jgi:hypothetical protein